ncbi:MAG: flagellar basal body-associated protein FliL [Sphingobium sp.]
MSEEAEPAPRKKGGKGKMIIIALVALVMSGAGVAGGLYASGAFGGHDEIVVKEDPNKPRLVLKGEDPLAIAEEAIGGSAGSGGEGGSKSASLPHVDSKVKLPKGGIALPRPKDISKYQATYFQMPAPYTSNVADTDSLVQITLAVSTYYDARVIEALKVHELALRSDILMLLSQQHEEALATPKGKEALQAALTSLINKVLREKTGYSGVDNVYFTNFVIQ